MQFMAASQPIQKKQKLWLSAPLAAVKHLLKWLLKAWTVGSISMLSLFNRNSLGIWGQTILEMVKLLLPCHAVMSAPWRRRWGSLGWDPRVSMCPWGQHPLLQLWVAETPLEIHVYTGPWLSPLIITNCFRKLLLCGENRSQGLFRARKCLAVFEGQLLLCRVASLGWEDTSAGGNVDIKYPSSYKQNSSAVLMEDSFHSSSPRGGERQKGARGQKKVDNLVHVSHAAGSDPKQCRKGSLSPSGSWFGNRNLETGSWLCRIQSLSIRGAFTVIILLGPDPSGLHVQNDLSNVNRFRVAKEKPKQNQKVWT